MQPARQCRFRRTGCSCSRGPPRASRGQGSNAWPHAVGLLGLMLPPSKRRAPAAAAAGTHPPVGSQPRLGIGFRERQSEGGGPHIHPKLHSLAVRGGPKVRHAGRRGALRAQGWQGVGG